MLRRGIIAMAVLAALALPGAAYSLSTSAPRVEPPAQGDVAEESEPIVQPTPSASPTPAATEAQEQEQAPESAEPSEVPPPKSKTCNSVTSTLSTLLGRICGTAPKPANDGGSPSKTCGGSLPGILMHHGCDPAPATNPCGTTGSVGVTACTGSKPCAASVPSAVSMNTGCTSPKPKPTSTTSGCGSGSGSTTTSKKSVGISRHC